MPRTTTALLFVLAACESGPRAIPMADVPPDLADEVAKAQGALDRLQEGLLARLKEELGKGGAVGAVTVCRDEAQLITAAVASETGVTVGRTSHRLRNAGNTAPSWVRPYVQRAETEPTHEPLAFDLGDRVGVLRPLFVAEPCLQCHGPTDGIDPEVRSILSTAYPEERATGFLPGQLRGFAWAEAPK